MKYFLFIIILLITSCKVTENKEQIPTTTTNGFGNSQYDNNDDNVNYNDSTSFIIIHHTDKIIVSSPVLSPVSSSPVYDVESSTLISNQQYSTTQTTSTIITEIKKTPNYSVGKMAYSVPDTMKVGNLYDITLRITKYEEDRVLIEGIDKNNNVKSKIVLNNIRVSSVMTALLIDVDSNFSIKSTSTMEQNIEEFGFTEWNWVVKPIKSGENRLRLLIKVRVFTENGDYLKDIPVYDQKIKVQSNIQWTLKIWLGKYWQWLMSTIIIPVFIYFWKKRKKTSK